jgi:hypothetical protein
LVGPPILSERDADASPLASTSELPDYQSK